jgi:AcrR family transcriptional regulator
MRAFSPSTERLRAVSSLTSCSLARPELHPTDTMLDAARELALESGVASATIGEIARVSGAPVGSIYHRFGSRAELLARLWIRAVRRSQASFIAAIDQPDPVAAAVAGALSILDFCESEPADAHLLVSFRREDLLRTAPSARLERELGELNHPIEQALEELARRLYGRLSRAAVERTVLVTFDLPYGAARRHLLDGHALPATLRSDVEAAARALLRHQLGQRGRRGTDRR